MTLPPELTEAVLEKLGLPAPPAPDRAGLDAVYAAWCRQVPFDNLVKRIHLASGSPEPFPNGPADRFFASWLGHGTGGTCWPSAGGLHALLVTLGFDARRGSAAMRDDVSGPIHSHGTTIVCIDGTDLCADTSMLTRRVFALTPRTETRLDDPVHALRVEPVDELWRVWWTHNFLDEMLGFLLLADDVGSDHYLTRYEASRRMSPFNTAVYATRTDRRRADHGRVRAPLRAPRRRHHLEGPRRRSRPRARRRVRLLGGDRGAAPGRRRARSPGVASSSWS